MQPDQGSRTPLSRRSISTVIVDDSRHAVNLLQTLIEEHFPQLTVVAAFSDPDEALGYLKENGCDLLLLDVQMPGLSGFELLESLYPFKGEVIFITAHDRFAVEAFKVHALHYLIKPVKPEELREAVSRLPVTSGVHDAEEVHKRAAQLKLAIHKVALHTLKGVEFIEINDIVRCESEGSYTHIFTTSGQKLSSRNLKYFEQLLSERGFFRLHSSHLVNVNHISKYVKGDGAYVVMSDGSTVSLSRTKREEFMKLFESA